MTKLTPQEDLVFLSPEAMCADLEQGWRDGYGWRVRQEADASWSVYEGEGFRKGGFKGAEEADKFIAELYRDEQGA